MLSEQKPQFNPYVPPIPLDMAELATVSLKEIRRPISVWLMQAILCISVWWAYALAFSKKAKRYFENNSNI